MRSSEMPTVRIQLDGPIRETFRVAQIAGMFDLPAQGKACVERMAELPAAGERWKIGAVVGPSGSGKTTIARAAFAGCLAPGPSRWPRDRALADCFPRLSIHTLLELFSAVGLCSPPAWLRPFAALSTGEQYRAEVLRALAAAVCLHEDPRRADGSPPLVLDEFTSHLDRDTTRSMSRALQRYVRRRICPLRLVAVTCHEDILPWLAPDWTLRMPAGRIERRSWAAPRLRLTVVRCRQEAWQQFAPHHYLSGGIARGASCYLARWEGRPAAFCAVLGQIGHAGRKRLTRLVTLPQFQGLGIGMRLAEHVCRCQAARGFRVSLCTSHPAVIRVCLRRRAWRRLGIKRHGGTRQRIGGRELRGSTGRLVVAFEYVGKSRRARLRRGR
jgi:GNAT superfamily N-acetyltransferase